VIDSRPSSVSGAFAKPFAEQVAFFRGKLGNLVPTARWDDVFKGEHDRGFMVAGALRADLLAALAGAVDRAIAEGRSLDGFRRDFRDIVTRMGWHGWTGEDSGAGQAWRTRMIYATNASTAYAAGRLAQLQDFPFWVYLHSDSALNPRPQHLAWNGLTLPKDHQFWATHYPPNGWGCGCHVAGARSADGARRLGGNPDKAIPDGWDQTSDKTGEPPGIDRGWGYKPGGGAVDAVRSLAPKLDQLPPRPAIDLIQSWLAADVFDRWYRAPSGSFPLVRLPPEDAAALGAQEGVTVAHLSADSAHKQIDRHPELTAQEYAQAQEVVDRATWKVVEKRSLIYIREDEVGGLILVVKTTTTGGGLWVTSYRRLSADAAKRDREIQRLRKKQGRA